MSLMDSKNIKKDRLFIIGAGDFGRELESWLQYHPDYNHKWELYGYLDDNPEALQNYPSDLKILGSPLKYQYNENDLVCFGISNPFHKTKIYENIKNTVKVLTFIFPNVIIGKYNKIGEGTVIGPNCILTTNINIGNCVTINLGSQIGHDVEICSYSSLMPNIDIGGHCKIGKSVFMGSGCTIIPKRKIGDNAKIGAGSVVITDVKDNQTVFGNPAKKIVL